MKNAGIEVSKNTIKISPRTSPLLKGKYIQDRLKFVEKHEIESDKFWTNVIWSYETKIEMLSETGVPMYGGKRTENNPVTTIKTVLMIWNCFSYNGVGEMEVIEVRMNAEKYKQILSIHLMKSTAGFGFEQDFVPQQDHSNNSTLFQ